MSTTISLHSIELWTRIGVTPEERKNPQLILASLDMEIDEGKNAGKTDALTETVDYAPPFEAIKKIAKGERNTLEKLGEDIANTALKENGVKNVTVKLQKFILPGMKEVILTIKRP